MTDKEIMTWMGSWFERLMIRFDRIEAHLEKMAIKLKAYAPRLLDTPSRRLNS